MRIPVAARSLLGLVLVGCGTPGPPAPPPIDIDPEALATGGAGGDTCRVDRLDETGPGSLYDCLVSQAGPRTVVFAVDGTLSLPENTYLRSNLTIDALAGGGRAVTLGMRADRRSALVLEGPVTNVVLRGLRFEGASGTSGAVESDLVALDGEDGLVSRVLVERCTFAGATDGALDITGEVKDAVVRENLFHGNPLTMLIRYGTREHLSLHRNVFAENGERNPQVRGDVRTLDFVNNVVYDWSLTPDGYGMEIRNEPGAMVDANVVGNVFLAARPQDGPGLSVFDYEGASSGRLYFADNLCRPGCDARSTLRSALSVPVPRDPWPAAELRARLLPVVGAPRRTDEDAAVLGRLGAALEGLR